MSGTMVHTFLGFSLFLVLLLAIRHPVAKWAGAKWAYALWVLPVAWLLIPVPSAMQVVDAPYALIIGNAPVAAEQMGAAVATQSTWEWASILLAVWGIGTAAFVAWLYADYRSFLKHAEPLHPHKARSEFGGVGVWESAAVSGPLAVGLLHRKILVPEEFDDRFEADEQQLALEHELIHHRRGDLWWNAAALGLLAANWFNPLAYVAYRAFRSDQELACDAAVAAKAPARRLQYASAILKSAADLDGPIAACALDGTTDLKRRLKMMKTHKQSFARTLLGAAAVAATAFAGVALAGPGAAAVQVERAPAAADHTVKTEEAVGPEKTTRPFPGPKKVIRNIEKGDVLAGPHRANCTKAEDQFELDLGAGPNSQDQLKFMVCNHGEGPAAMIQTLEQAVSHLSADGDMPKPHREKIISALQAEIARRKAAL